MDWDELRYVLALRRGGTLSAAASELGVARTTVGRRLDTLEAALNVRLFERTPDGLVETPAGRDLADVAALIEGEVLAAQGRVAGRDADLRGSLRVATVDFLFRVFAGVFADFTERFEGVELSVDASDDVVSLRRREADVALRLGNAPKEQLIGRRLGSISLAVYASRRLVDRIGLDAPLRDFPWVKPDAEDPALDAWLDAHAPGYRVALRGNGYEVARSAVSAGIGVCVLPRLDADRDASLVRLPGVGTAHRVELWVLTLPELRSNSRVQAFMQHAFDNIRGVLRTHPAAAHETL